jgi:hypothetical protein
MNALSGARGKLAEAHFFLDLLKRIERDRPLTAASLDTEATYFTSALLSACFSVLEHLECQGKRALRAINTPESKSCESELEGDVAALRAQNSALYATDENGRSRGTYGLRHLSVHHRMVEARHRDQTRTSAPYGRLRYGAVEHDRRFYVDHPNSGDTILIVATMSEHVCALGELVARWEDRIASLGGCGDIGT